MVKKFHGFQHSSCFFLSINVVFFFHCLRCLIAFQRRKHICCVLQILQQVEGQERQHSWLRDDELAKVREAVQEGPLLPASSKTESVVKLVTDILVKEAQRLTAAQVAIRASGVLGRWQQYHS